MSQALAQCVVPGVSCATSRAVRVALALCLLAPAAFADDTRYQDYPVGARAATLGGAFAAIADDASGLTYNPAGLCDTKNLNLSASASLYGLERQGRANTNVVDKGTFTLGTLATLNVIPGEAGSVKAVGAQTDQGSDYAYGFDVTVPSFRSYGSDTASPTVLHTRVVDRTFDAAAGGAMRINTMWSVGAAVHFNLRLFSDTEDALVTNGASDPRVGVYHAEATFANASLSLTGGVKGRFEHGWLGGASISTPGVRIYSNGSVQLQDVVTDPNATGPHTQVSIVNTTNVQSATGIPLLLRVGVAKVQDKAWTLTGQLTLHLPTSYDRFQLDPNVAQRLQFQTHVERSAVLNANFGAEYLFAEDKAVAGGLFTDFSSAPSLQTATDGTILPGSSHLDNVSLYGAAASVAFLGEHSVSRIGMTFSYGRGEEAVPQDPTGISNPNGYTRSIVSQLFLYVFLAGSFRY